MSCDDFRLSRRRFLAGATALLGGAAVSGMIGDIFTQTAFAAPGGNNARGAQPAWRMRWPGLIVPHGDPGYRRARPMPCRPRPCWPRTPCSGCTRSSSRCSDVERRPFGAVQAVGMPGPTAHFAAMEAVEDADPGPRPSRLGEPDDRAYSGRRSAGGYAAGQHHAADVPGRAGRSDLGPAAGGLPATRRGRQGGQARMRMR